MQARKDERGVVAVELVVVFPILLMLFTAILSVGGYLVSRTDVTGQAYNAARNLALTGSVGAISSNVKVESQTPCPASGPGTAIVQVAPMGGDNYSIKVAGIPTVTKSLVITGKYPCNNN
jgi:Flp pilus assembly protein TadG